MDLSGIQQIVNKLYSALPSFSSKSKEPSPWDVPPKTCYYDKPQSEYDLNPEWTENEPPFELKKYSLQDLLHLVRNVEVGNEERVKLFHHIITEVEEKGFFILTETEEQLAKNREVRKELKNFLDQSLEEKKKYDFASSTKSKSRGGYSQIFFDNRDSVRDPEYRDVYQFYMRNQFPNSVPSEKFQELIEDYFQYQWEITVSILALIVTELGYDLSHITKLFELEGEEDIVANNIDDLIQLRSQTENTNMSFFRYYDTQNYTEPQKCMVHQDGGLVTLVPRSSSPGVFVLYHDYWVPIENYINDTDIVVYFGLAMNWLSLERIRAVFHRVVRQPNATRYSWPFEMKPNDRALLVPYFKRDDCIVKDPITFEKLKQNIGWLRVMISVERTDGKDFTKENPPRDLVYPISPLTEQPLLQDQEEKNITIESI